MIYDRWTIIKYSRTRHTSRLTLKTYSTKLDIEKHGHLNYNAEPNDALILLKTYNRAKQRNLYPIITIVIG